MKLALAMTMPAHNSGVLLYINPPLSSYRRSWPSWSSLEPVQRNWNRSGWRTNATSTTSSTSWRLTGCDYRAISLSDYAENALNTAPSNSRNWTIGCRRERKRTPRNRPVRWIGLGLMRCVCLLIIFDSDKKWLLQ